MAAIATDFAPEGDGANAKRALNELLQLPSEQAVDVIVQAFSKRPELAQSVVNKTCPELTYAPAKALTNRRAVGKIKSFSSITGYGFIACHELKQQFGCDVFLHKAQFTGFSVDQEVTFAVLLSKEQRPVAFDLMPNDSSTAPMTPPPGTFGLAAPSCPDPRAQWAPKAPEQWPVQPPWHAAPQHQRHWIGQPGRIGAEASGLRLFDPSRQPRMHLEQGAIDFPAAKAWPLLHPSSASTAGPSHGRSVHPEVVDLTRGAKLATEDNDVLLYKRYRGRVKSLKSDRFGFIECTELFDRFKRDIFVQPSQLNDCEVGSEVTFGIFLNKQGQPQATKIKEARFGSGTAPDGIAQDGSEAERQVDQVFEGAVCSICQEVLHRATSAQPCLHSFCSACLGGWLTQATGVPNCPICRQPICSVSRNHTLEGLICSLLKAHPSRRRSVNEIEELDAQDTLHQLGYDLDAMVTLDALVRDADSDDEFEESDAMMLQAVGRQHSLLEARAAASQASLAPRLHLVTRSYTRPPVFLPDDDDGYDSQSLDNSDDDGFDVRSLDIPLPF